MHTHIESASSGEACGLSRSSGVRLETRNCGAECRGTRLEPEGERHKTAFPGEHPLQRRRRVGRVAHPVRHASPEDSLTIQRGVLSRTPLGALALGPVGGQSGDYRHRWSAHSLGGGPTKSALKRVNPHGEQATQRHGKKEGSLKDLFNKTPAKKTVLPGTPVRQGGEVGETSQAEGAEVPLTRTFMEQLFESLCEEFATRKEEIAAEVKDVRREVIELGQRVDTLEQTHDAREEEVDSHRQELLILQDKNQELHYH
ncbi:hypothetical protein NDU88_008717 [Pleurodeles waltl]|uniref:Uncharacterized protein n=1 Tax=Pleurodeles waltl TaxID=8319 RepID=A0AAV7PR70_PLEWA|nr:hypothetical protein NDU88_008717 [Pleurodeles waltl]